MSNSEPSLKLKTARTLKWNAIDRLSSQLMYAVTGVVLANILSPDDFGLVGALLAFQAFASLFVDSGFASALLQRKTPTDRDYSTIFWFNLTVALAVYAVLWVCAPLIAEIFQNDRRLIPLSKVMFLTFILNGLAIVQTNRLMKRMDVKQIAISNLVAQISSGGLGIWLAIVGYGPWALVWQYVSMAAVKTGWLWITGHWLPTAGFHLDSIRSMWRIGMSVFSSSALNTLCQNIYSFIIGAFYSLASLGLYTQADKWSKMGSASISQIFTSSFVPLLAGAQDNRERFNAYVRRINRFAGFILFPALLGITGIGAPLFHTLFGTKWDAAIILFQILTVRGIFITLVALYSNYLMSLGYARRMFIIELVKDSLIVVAILSTVWWDNIPLLVWGQMISSLITYFVTLAITCRATGYSMRNMLGDLVHTFIISMAMLAVELIVAHTPIVEGAMIVLSPALSSSPLSVQIIGAVQLATALVAGAAVYLGLCHMTRLPELPEALNYLLGRFRKKK